VVVNWGKTSRPKSTKKTGSMIGKKAPGQKIRGWIGSAGRVLGKEHFRNSKVREPRGKREEGYTKKKGIQGRGKRVECGQLEIKRGGGGNREPRGKNTEGVKKGNPEL